LKYNNNLEKSLTKLHTYCNAQGYKGYDPYDTLNSFFPFSKLGSSIPVYAIQVQKRNPVNIRPLLGIKKDYNPKGLGLFLKAYSILYQIYGDEKYLKQCNELYNTLIDLTSKGYSGACWGYNFDWASPGSYLPRYTPSVVVTSFVVDGLIEYYKIDPSTQIKETIISSGNYIINDLPITKLENGICFAYTEKSKGCCYNASLLGVETLAKIYSINKNSSLLDQARSAVNYVLTQQKPDGSWYYSIDFKTGKERRQIDFHQGFVLMSLENYMRYSGDYDSKIISALKKGLEFYRNEQFKENGVSKWRLPKEYPIDIHNQAQGIITFAELSKYSNEYLQFAETIAEWSIKNMQDAEGYFYYRNYRFYKNKIPFMRWGQDWMLLALATLLKKKHENEN